MALGPVLEQLNQDLLDPLIDISFQMHLDRGLLPPPPQELQGVDLKVEYVSMMAQAQKLIGIAGVERFTGYVGQLAQFDPSVIDKFNVEQAVDIYADITSVPPSLVRSDEKVAEIKNQRAQAQAQQQQMEQAAMATNAAKSLSETAVGDSNALEMMIQNSGGVV